MLKFLYRIHNGECFRSTYSLRSSIGEKTRTHLITEISCIRILKVKKRNISCVQLNNLHFGGTDIKKYRINIEPRIYIRRNNTILKIHSSKSVAHFPQYFVGTIEKYSLTA